MRKFVLFLSKILILFLGLNIVTGLYAGEINIRYAMFLLPVAISVVLMGRLVKDVTSVYIALTLTMLGFISIILLRSHLDLALRVFDLDIYLAFAFGVSSLPILLSLGIPKRVLRVFLGVALAFLVFCPYCWCGEII